MNLTLLIFAGTWMVGLMLTLVLLDAIDDQPKWRM